jgi:hypothetical protein
MNQLQHKEYNERQQEQLANNIINKSLWIVSVSIIGIPIIQGAIHNGALLALLQ